MFSLCYSFWSRSSTLSAILSGCRYFLAFSFLEEIRNMTLIKHLIKLISLYGFENIFKSWSIIDIVRIIRNSLLIMINGYSFLLPLLIVVIFINWIRNKNWPEIIFFFSFFIPFFLTGRFWYGGLYGRYGSFIAYGLALMIALIPNRIIYYLMIISIIIAFIPTFIAYQKSPIPLIQKKLISQIDFTNKDLIILSDYQRPQLTYPNGLYINGNDEETKTVEKKILMTLKNNRKVFISQQAITFPYWQYDGQQIHIISKKNTGKSVLNQFLHNKKLIKVAVEEKYPFFSIYQIR